MQFCYLAIGAFIGAILRYSLSLIIIGSSFPYATLTANLIGSFFMGIVLILSHKLWGKQLQLRMFFAVGLLGSFTTFSTYTLETIKLLELGYILKAITYYILSTCIGIALAILGVKLSRSLLYKYQEERGQ